MRVLVVEYESLIRLDLAQMLREDGCIVDEASNGLEALSAMRRSVPDVVLLDLRMPVMNGYEFNAERKRDPTLASVPLVLISANAHDAEARTLGAAAAVDKPVRKAALLAAVRALASVSSS